jgi:cytochrome c oxidase subunit 3
MPATSGVFQGGGVISPPGRGGGGGGGSPDSSGGHGSERRASFTGLWVGLAAIVMFFAAFTSIFIVLRTSREWVHTPLPAMIWVNTAMLVISSGALEMARRGLRSGHRTAFNVYWTAGTVLGVGFLVGQYVAWQQLMSAGLHVSSNPSSAFFYVLTATHAAHILAGVLALIYVNVQALRLRLGPGKRTVADLSAVYWHFVDGIWLYLLVLLAVWG